LGFIQDFTGSSARKDLKKSNAQSKAYLAEGYGDQTEEYDGAIAGYNPFVSGGVRGQTMYDDGIGINGLEKQQAVASQFAASDPWRQWNEDNAMRANDRSANASGRFVSGVGALANARTIQDSGSRDYNAWLDRLAGSGQQGFQATNAVAGLKTAKGDNAFNYGATRAGNAINFGNSMAASRSTLSNNLIGLAGVASKFFKPSPVA
jgi:hypothetical protein